MDRDKLKVIVTDLEMLLSALKAEVYSDTESYKYDDIQPIELDYDEEEALCKDFTPCTFLTHFPLRTHPFWNMKHAGNGIYNKVDVIMHGMETIGSAERATDTYEMREQFHNISDGEYANLLYNHFGKKRVEDELEEYLSLDMFERFGGGMAVTRMVAAMNSHGLLNGK